jgi:hypothetical protein
VTLILLHVGNHESEIGGDQPLGGFLIARLGSSRKSTLFFRVAYEREFLYVL